MIKKMTKQFDQKKAKLQTDGAAIYNAHWLKVAILLILVLTVYSNSLDGSFVEDDLRRWESTTWVEDVTVLTLVKNLIMPHGTKYRPMPQLTHIIDYHLWGLNPTGFHITNTVFHVIATLLVYLVMLNISGSRFVPFVSACLFAVHPIHTEAITFIAGRTDAIMAVFFLLSFWSYTEFRKCRGRRRYLFYSGSTMFFVFALMSKEAAIVMPLALLLYEFYFYRYSKVVDIFWKLFLPLMPFALIGGCYTYLQTSAGDTAPISANQVDMVSQLSTMIISYSSYVSRLIYPLNLSYANYYDWSESFWRPNATVPLLFILSLIVAAFWVKRYSKIASFGIAWVLSTLLPVSNLIALDDRPLMADRYLYLPSVGFCMVLSSLIAMPFGRHLKRLKGKKFKLIGFLMFMVLLIGYSVLTLERNPDWSSQRTVLEKIAQQHPTSLYARIILGRYYILERMYDHAIRALTVAIDINRSSAQAYYHLGRAYDGKRKLSEAEASFKQAIILDGTMASAYCDLGGLYFREGFFDQARQMLTEAIELKPDLKDAHRWLAKIYSTNKEYDKSRYHQEKADTLEQVR